MKRIFKLSVCTLLVIPFNENWKLLKYRKIPSNKIELKKTEMIVKVNGSASPIIYPFKKPVMISRITAQGKVSGSLNIKNPKLQGEKKHDDFVFRIGLVREGNKTLSFWQKKIAPDWVLKLYSLAPKGTGIKHIHFLNVAMKRAFPSP